MICYTVHTGPTCSIDDENVSHLLHKISRKQYKTTKLTFSISQNPSQLSYSLFLFQIYGNVLSSNEENYGTGQTPFS